MEYKMSKAENGCKKGEVVLRLSVDDILDEEFMNILRQKAKAVSVSEWDKLVYENVSVIAESRLTENNIDNALRSCIQTILNRDGYLQNSIHTNKIYREEAAKHIKANQRGSDIATIKQLIREVLREGI